MSLTKSRQGFTLIELLVVIAIISILIALVTIAAGMMMQRSKSTRDLGNHRTFGMATFSHATDHNGKLLHPVTEPFGQPDPHGPAIIERLWVAAYGDDVNGQDRLRNVGGEYVELQNALKEFFHKLSILILWDYFCHISTNSDQDF